VVLNERNSRLTPVGRPSPRYLNGMRLSPPVAVPSPAALRRRWKKFAFPARRLHELKTLKEQAMKRLAGAKGGRCVFEELGLHYMPGRWHDIAENECAPSGAHALVMAGYGSCSPTKGRATLREGPTRWAITPTAFESQKRRAKAYPVDASRASSYSNRVSARPWVELWRARPHGAGDPAAMATGHRPRPIIEQGACQPVPRRSAVADGSMHRDRWRRHGTAGLKPGGGIHTELLQQAFDQLIHDMWASRSCCRSPS